MAKPYDDEEIDEIEADGSEEEEAEDEAEDSGESASGSSGEGGGGGGAKSEAAALAQEAEERTVASRQAQRDEMDRQVAEFLSRGGQIQKIDPNVTADPPRKPESDYGSRPI